MSSRWRRSISSSRFSNLALTSAKCSASYKMGEENPLVKSGRFAWYLHGTARTYLTESVAGCVSFTQANIFRSQRIDSFLPCLRWKALWLQ